jgi:uncharacterized protein (TIGR04255 family)
MPSPLTGRPPPEVHLTNAPVARVIAQVRFPPIASLNQQAFIGPFQEAIRDEYAVMRSAAANRVQVTMPGQPRIDLSTDHAWLFHDLNHPWRAVLASDFLALETRAYTSRADLLLRLDRLVAALAIHVRPGAIDRIGVRYIDRLTGDALWARMCLTTRWFAPPRRTSSWPRSAASSGYAGDGCLPALRSTRTDWSP